jgi:hypothetical protein
MDVQCDCSRLYIFWRCLCCSRKVHVKSAVWGYMFLCVVHMQVISTDFINVIFFQGIQMSVLPSCPYDIHGICYCSVCMPCVWYMV